MIGDIIEIDIRARRLELKVEDAVLAETPCGAGEARAAVHVGRPDRVVSCVLQAHAAMATPASDGAVRKVN